MDDIGSGSIRDLPKRSTRLSNGSGSKRIPPAVPPATVATINRNYMVGLKVPELVENQQVEKCKYCNRKFTLDRISIHQAICKNIALVPKRKIFDSQKQRLAGTDAEPFARFIKPVERPVSNWKKNHEDLIEAIRAARRAHAYLAKGGNPADLPPPPPSDYSDYVQCPHCGRRFNKLAAAKHIPQCQKSTQNEIRANTSSTPESLSSQLNFYNG